MVKPHALGLGGAIVTGVAAILCSAAYALFPNGAVEFFSFVTHKNIAAIVGEITWAKFFGGVVFWVVAVYVALFLIGWLHNKLAE
ncbi:MAG: DUF5676 family membrane protein [Patescibacteria group bacterium]